MLNNVLQFKIYLLIILSLQNAELSMPSRLTVLRQIIEALIYLKHLGIVHTTISSQAIYLIDMDHAKLANFEHAILHP